jgi:hypothetical protein
VALTPALGTARGSRRSALRGALRVGTGLLTAAALIASARDASAFVVKTTTNGELVHWESRTVDYAIAPSVADATSGSVDATFRAMRDWSGSVGAPELRAHAADAEDPKKPGFDQKNGVFFMAGGYKPAGRALAITILTYDNASGRILDADIVFNGAYRFTIHRDAAEAVKAAPVRDGTVNLSATDGIAHDESPTLPSDGVTYDLHHIVAHELGHSLGLNDEMVRRDVLMYRYTPPNDPGLRTPTQDDIEGLAQLYSTQVSAGGNGCGNAAVAPKKPSHADSQAAMVGVFGLLVFLALRARGDRRARYGFVATMAFAALALLPSVSPSRGTARASEIATTSKLGHARARVTSSATTTEDGLLRTTFALATTTCRTLSCPRVGSGTVWGGVSGNVRQEVGGQHAPTVGEAVDVSFASLPDGLAPLSKPLGGRDPMQIGEVVVITPAR